MTEEQGDEVIDLLRQILSEVEKIHEEVQQISADVEDLKEET